MLLSHSNQGSFQTIRVPLVLLQDLLQCQPDEIVKFAKEKYHPHLNKAFAEAGMPWAQGKLGGE